MTLADLLSQLDPRSDVRGRQFERICAWYLRNAPEYRERIRKVWLWSEWPGAWAADAGIDLVADERDGRLWAIQAKAYDPSYAIKKSDVDSFLSESSRPQFSYRLLIATTDHLGPTARRTLDSQREPVGYLLRSQLEFAQVSWPHSHDDLRPRRPTRKRPLPHVREAIDATVSAFADQERGQLIMACGTGKTLAAMWIAERLESKRTLVLVPSLSLLAQTLREWSANASNRFDYLAVCSDETVAEGDELVQHTAELGLPVTTDPALIAAFLRRRGRRVVFSTYQSSPQIAAAYRQRTPQLDLAIADEAHRCAGRVASEFATIFDDGQIHSRRRLFMTATPRFYTQRLRTEAGLLDVEVASMDDESVFGPVLHRLTFGEAIARELLSDYQVLVVGVNNDMYRAWAEHGEFVTPDGKKVTDARMLAGEIAVVKAMRKYDLQRVITFHSRVNAARRFSEDVPYVCAWMPARVRPRKLIWSEHVSGAMSSGHRDRLLLRFRDLAAHEIGLLSNARCLGEGVDVPSLDGVAFIDPRGSTIDIIQAVGRAIRKAPDKKLGTVVLPVFLADDEDPEKALDESTFRYVWDVLKALRAHDEALGEELDELRRRLGARRSPPQRPGKIKLDVPVGRVGAEFVRAFNARLVEQTTASWEFWFGLLERFVVREGHARVPLRHREDGYRLGGWVANQRQMVGQDGLAQDRRARLEALPGWVWSTQDADWEEGFAHLRKFVEREGHARVPKEHLDDGYALGAWVAKQRSRLRFRRRGESAERRRRLEALPGWVWDTLEADWEEGFAHLRHFVEREGHARVPHAHREDGYRLGQWVDLQRQVYRGRRKGELARERRTRLEVLPGWSWDILATQWEQGFAHLRRFAEREGHVRVAHAYREENYPLGQWVFVQRQTYRKGKLDRERCARLEGLPGWAWDAREASWEESFDRLRRFVEHHGDARVPQSYREDGYRLGGWVSRQRELGREGKLVPERRARLEGLAGWAWDPKTADWEEGFAHLRRFVEREGHARVPHGHREDGFPLSQWVTVQRQLYRGGRQGGLDRLRRARLEALPGWVWDPRESRWENGYARLVRFVEREGHSRVPPAHREGDGFRLGAWVDSRRVNQRRGLLAEQRVRRLEALPGWAWNPQEAAWEDSYERLRHFVERNGHSLVPYSYRDDDGYRLGAWVSHQRGMRRRGNLSADCARRLESIPGWTWDARQQRLAETPVAASRHKAAQ